MDHKLGKIPETRFLEHVNLVYGLAGLLLAAVSWWTTRFEVVLGFLAGGGWVLVTALFYILADLRRQMSALEEQLARRDDEIADMKLQIQEWRSVATADSDTLNKFVSRALPQASAVARKR